MPVRVVIADDHGVVLTSLGRALDQDPTITVVGQARDGLEALDVIVAQQPDAVVLDHRMPGLLGTEVAARVADALPGVVVLIYTSADDEERLEIARHPKVDAVVSKTVRPTAVARAILRATGVSGA